MNAWSPPCSPRPWAGADRSATVAVNESGKTFAMSEVVKPTKSSKEDSAINEGFAQMRSAPAVIPEVVEALRARRPGIRVRRV